MATKRIREELVEATEQLVIAMAESNHAGAQLKLDRKEAISELKATIEEVLTL